MLSQNQPTLKLKYTVNTTGCNKDWDFKKLAKNFRDKEGTINDVINHVKKGHALCAGNLGGKWRAKSNVVGSQWVLLDIDNSGKDANGEKCYEHQLTLDEAIEHPFIQRYCALIYTTASHKPNWHKFRLVFLLPEFVPGYEIVEVLTRYLMKHLPHDPACKDASRVFYGSTEASFPLIQPNVTLPAEWITEAIATAEQEKLEYQKRIEAIEKRKAELRDRAETEGWDTDALIQQALSYIPPRQIGSGNYDECIKVLMALNGCYGAAEGELIAERWSPSIKGTTWNVGAKFRSFRSRCGISIGTLFHIAKQYGFKFPAPEKKFKRKYDEQRERDLEIIEATSARLNKLRQKISNTLANPIRHITPRVKRRIQKPNVLSYVPGKLPAIENWEKQGKPKIQFANASDRKQLLKEAIDKGYSEILDNSHPGLGKSYSAGEFKPNDFGVDKLIYQDINHRNASTATVEDNFADIPVRNNGYKIDYTRATPSGQPFQIRTKPREQPDTPSNCHRTYVFNALRDKNYNDAFDLEESGVSPVCDSCSLSDQCKYSSGDGYGFRMQKREVINSSDKLRTHPDTAPKELYNDNDDKSPLLIGRIWEEAGVAINSIKKTEVSADDLYQTFGRLSIADYPKDAALKPLFEMLGRLLNQQIKPTNRYGFDDSDIKKLIRDYYESSINSSSDSSDIESFVDKALYELATYGLEELEQSLLPDLSFLQEKDGIDATPQELKKSKTLRYANKQVAKESARDAGQKALALPLYWLTEFIEAWVGNGAFRCEYGKLSIYTRDLRHKELAENAAFNLYLDATLSPELLKLKLGIQKPILVIEQSPPDYSNLNIVQLTGLGKLGKQRSDSLTNRVDALKSALLQKHSNLGVLEWKSNAGDNEYSHFADGRGVNRFSNCDAIASFGIPYANVGELTAEYQVLTGNSVLSETTQQFITELTDSEIVQEVGRIRANRRPNEQLTFYFCADYDLTFLNEHFPGATLTSIDAFVITPDAGSKNQQTKLSIVEAAKELITREAKVTQQTIANAAEITQGTVSKIASQFGGWSSLKKLFPTLLNSLYSKRNNFDGANIPESIQEDLPFLAKEYLPTLASAEVSTLEAIQAMVEVLEVIGETVFRQLLEHLDVTVKGKLLGKLLPIDSVEAQIILDLTPT